MENKFDILNVAACILNESGYMTTMKLQKLCYYSQAYSLVFHDKKLFDDDFEAWINGPVCRKLYNLHKNKFVVGPGFLDKGKLNPDYDAAQCINSVIKAYGNFSGNQLSEMTHNEKPWANARAGLDTYDKCNNIITTDSIRDYYSSSNSFKILFV